MNDDRIAPDGEPWQWPEAVWRAHRRPRPRRTQPARRQPGRDGARCAVAIRFDADHETIPLRDADESPMRISQGQYGDRQAMPRIRALLERESVPATLLLPRGLRAAASRRRCARVAGDGHEIGIHSWIHERNTTLPREAERDLTLRAAEVLDAASPARAPVGMRTASWDFSRQHARYHPRDGAAVRQLA